MHQLRPGHFPLNHSPGYDMETESGNETKDWGLYYLLSWCPVSSCHRDHVIMILERGALIK